MTTFFFNDANFLFSTALFIVVLLFSAEVIGIFLGSSLFGLFSDIPDFDIEVPSVVALISWLALDRLPMIIWLVIFLTIFSLSGYVFNIVWLFANEESFITPVISVPMALFFAALLTGRVGALIALILPKEESSAMSDDDFVGVVAQITVGSARMGCSAEAKYIDKFNQLHYVLVQPFENDDEFVSGDKVILVKKETGFWLVTGYL
ncbi:YqiJ family protein [Marinomonas sp. C2222]|uniref:YqiJ family protein n=1 Tax=Marinomonas sargassi TaxID=2984494 RepID=A0ABT2YTG6_9GAMM|nr:YqiJ family protein [Marinomonas sargassi]MCV2403183.1 YqiJ family protein [Marinomonas sargassi]